MTTWTAELIIPGSRTDKPRRALADLSTNGPRIPKKRGRKAKVVQTSSYAAGNQTSTEAYLAHPDILPQDYRPSTKLAVAAKKHLLAGSPSVYPHRRAFRVFNDPSSPSPRDNPYGPAKKQDSFDNSSPSHNADAKPGAICSDATVGRLSWYNEPRSHVKFPSRSENSENIPPPPVPQAQDKHPESSKGRVTQRYFSITGSEEPQFFDSIPPQMEFGGMAGPQYRGATVNPLNPLNPLNSYFHMLHSQSQSSWTSPTLGPAFGDNGQHRRQLVPRGLAIGRKANDSKDS